MPATTEGCAIYLEEICQYGSVVQQHVRSKGVLFPGQVVLQERIELLLPYLQQILWIMTFAKAFCICNILAYRSNACTMSRAVFRTTRSSCFSPQRRSIAGQAETIYQR